MLAALLAGAGLLFFVARPYAVGFADAVFTYSFLLLPTAVVPMLWRAWRRRSNFLWLFAIGWGAPIARALIGARVGDERVVRLPTGEKSYEVLSVSYPRRP